jgi:TRAP-type C4-dicarboxylate transport system substrate-binding protein
MKFAIQVFLAICLLSPATGAFAQAKFVYGSAAPIKGPEAQAIIKYFDQVEKAAGGSLKIERTFDGQVVQARATLPGVRDGLVDASFVYDTFFTTDLKSSMVITDLAMMSGHPLALAGAVNETILLNCPSCDTDFSRVKARPIAYNGVAPFYLLSRNPVNSVDDLKGKSIRAASAFGVFSKAIGATPVSVVPGEVYEAMQRGAVDGAITGGVWLRSYNLWDVAKFVVDLPLGQYNSSALFVAGTGSWKGLSAAHKKALVDRLPFLVAEATLNHIRETKEILEEAGQRGVKLTPAPADLKSFVEKYRQGEPERAAKDGKGKGVEKADQLVKTFVDRLSKWEKIVAEVGGDRSKYEEALRAEIFGRVKW